VCNQINPTPSADAMHRLVPAALRAVIQVASASSGSGRGNGTCDRSMRSIRPAQPPPPRVPPPWLDHDPIPAATIVHRLWLPSAGAAWLDSGQSTHLEGQYPSSGGYQLRRAVGGDLTFSHTGGLGCPWQIHLQMSVHGSRLSGSPATNRGTCLSGLHHRVSCTSGGALRVPTVKVYRHCKHDQSPSTTRALLVRAVQLYDWKVHASG
jgi:hypothetical protein